MTLVADFEDFVHDHRVHGSITADASSPAWNVYLLTVVVFERWITPWDAELDLLRAAGLN